MLSEDNDHNTQRSITKLQDKIQIQLERQDEQHTEHTAGLQRLLKLLKDQSAAQRHHRETSLTLATELNVKTEQLRTELNELIETLQTPTNPGQQNHAQ